MEDKFYKLKYNKQGIIKFIMKFKDLLILVKWDNAIINIIFKNKLLSHILSTI